MQDKAKKSLNRKRYRRFAPFTALIRLFYKAVLPANLQHMVRTKPFLKLAHQQGDCFQVFWKGKFAGETGSWNDLKQLQTKRVFSVGSGPSIKDQSFELINANEAVLVNGAAQLAVDGRIKKPLIVMVEDGRFIYERYQLLMQLPKGTRLGLVSSAMQALGAVAGVEGLKHFRLYLINGFETHYGKPRREMTDAPEGTYRASNNAKLSLDLSQGHYGCGTVMYCGMQLAFTLGVEELFLVGFDLTNFNQPRFYETENNAAWTGLAKAYETRILPAMKLAKTTAEERGMVIYNCSHTSIVPRDIFPFNGLLMEGRLADSR